MAEMEISNIYSLIVGTLKNKVDKTGFLKVTSCGFPPGGRGQEARDRGLHCANHEEQEAAAAQSACHRGGF